jgi:hypothetical protein
MEVPMGHLEDAGKESYFEKHGYDWVPSLESYVSHEQWKVFTRNYIDDHSFDTLLAHLNEEPLIGQWKIYANTESEVDIHTVNKHYGITD